MKKLALFCVIACLFAAVSEATIIDPRYSNTIAEMTAQITNVMATGNIVGLSIALVDSNQIVWAQGFGYADRENQILATEDTVYRIGSVSKVFTTIAALQLWEQSKFALDDPLANYISGFAMLPRFTNTAPVTVRTLMCHISGIPGDLFNGGDTVVPWNGYDAWCTNYIQHDYPTYPVNYVMMYDNSAYSFLGSLIEVLTGTNIVTYAQPAIFAPMGMTNTSYINDRASYSNLLSRNYLNGVLYPDESLNAYEAGSVYSSAADMTKLIKLVLEYGNVDGNQIIASNTLTTMLEPQATNVTIQLNSSNATQLALGWDSTTDVQLNYAGRLCRKNGGTTFFASLVEVLRDQSLGVIIVQNSQPPNVVDSLGRNALKLAVLEKTSLHWPTNEYSFPSSPVTNIPDGELQNYAGIYAANLGYDRISVTNGTLTWVIGENLPTQNTYSNLEPHENGYFYSADMPELQITFTNIDTNMFLTVRIAEWSTGTYTFVDQKYNPVAISSNWLARTTNSWVIDDLFPTDIGWYLTSENFALGFLVTNDLMLASFAATKLMCPSNDSLAFAQGLYNRSASSLFATNVNGSERLYFAGFRFRAIDSVPSISVNVLTNGVLEPRITTWYAFTTTASNHYRVALSAPTNVFMNVLDGELNNLGRATSRAFYLFSASNTTYYIGISSTNAEEFQLYINRIADWIPAVTFLVESH